MNRIWGVLALASCLAVGCGKESPTEVSVTDGGVTDGGVTDGGGDTGLWGSPGIDVIAGRLGGIGNADGVGADARLSVVMTLAWDGAGNLLVSEGQGIRKVEVATRAVTRLPQVNVSPATMAFDGTGTLYFAAGRQISKVVLASGEVTAIAGDAFSAGSRDGVGTNARFSSPSGVALDGAGNLFVADKDNRSIRQIALATGEVTTLAGSGVSGSNDGTGSAALFDSPSAVASDGAGNLYVADTNNHTIRKIVTATREVTTLAGAAGTFDGVIRDGTGAAASFRRPMGLAWDGAGNLYVADSETVRKIVVATGVVTTVAGDSLVFGRTDDGTGAAAHFSLASALTTDGAGNVYVGDRSTVRKVVAASGVVTTLAGLARHAGSVDGTGTAARFSFPTGVVWDGANNLYVVCRDDFTIRKVVAKTGVVTTLAGSALMLGSSDGTGAAARFQSPDGITTDGAGNLFVTDSANHTIRKIVAATGEVTTLAGTAGLSGSSDGTGAAARFFYPQGLTSDGAGNLYVVDSGNQTIRKFVIATGEVTTLAGTPGAPGSIDGTGAAAGFSSLRDVAWDAGNLYVAEFSVLRKIVVATGVVTTLAGGVNGSADGTGTEARFSAINGLTSDGAGTLYVTDAERVRKVVTATGAVTTVLGVVKRQGVLLGAVPGSLNWPWRLAMIPGQGLVITDAAESVILIALGL